MCITAYFLRSTEKQGCYSFTNESLPYPWYGLRFEPRVTDLEDQLQELYCADDPALYKKCLIRLVGQIDRQLIVSEKQNIDQSVATLALKEMTQGTLIRKLCTYTAPNPTRRAIFEFDKLVRSIYALRLS